MRTLLATLSSIHLYQLHFAACYYSEYHITEAIIWDTILMNEYFEMPSYCIF